MRKILFSIFILSSKLSLGQTITASFNAPDTVCVNSPVNIQNTSQGATNYFWSFCTANINQPPIGTNLGNVGGLLSAPVYIDYVFTNGNYYGFVTNNYPGGLLRLDFGNSLLNTPVVTNLGNIGSAIANNTEGVQIANDNGNWYVLIVGGNAPSGSTPSLTTISLGTNITNNNPTATNWGNIGNLSYPHDLYVFNDNGHWYGLTVNYSNNTITLFDLTTSLSNTPSAVNLGNIGNLSGPTGIQAINDNGNWRVFVTNATSSTLTRLDFGSSLLNIPTGVNLGNPNNSFVTCWDIYILRYCGENEAFVINANGSNDIVKLDFGNSLLNNPTAVSLGNQGNLNFPHCISKLFRVGADVFSFITNVKNNTLTLLQFKGCTNANIPNSTAQNPPPITYNTPGTYNINLTVDDGLPTQTSYCKQVVVQNCNAAENIINDYTEVLGFNICKNELTVADASKYNPGDTVLLIQMKGAVIDSSNTSNFGTVTDYKNAGNYEYNYVKQKTGNVIQLKNLITRQYDIPTGKVQLVRVPYFDNLTVNNKLTCLQWDGSKGGVLAFNVKNTLTMNADIDVSGKGFIGGQVINPKNNSFYCHENNYYYPNDPIKAAPKGEGIAFISNQKIFGKGALGNGGGGGLEHNSGGGGGSNVTNGGLGGKEWITCGPPINNNGIGGKALAYSNIANKIFLGGGGGAGHCDNIPGFNPLGGNGGGIIIIKSSFIKTNNNLITADGGGGIECFRDAQAYKCHEGMGGGGGGGAILIDANTFLDNTNIHINGGKGADMNGEIQGQLGPGGGGGGGLCWLSNAALPGNILITQNGGINGVNIDFGNDSYGATPGQAGSNLFNLKIPFDTILFKPNIDSVRIKDSATSCNSFDFKGLGYTNTAAINSWKWSFGDGGSDAQQNTSHTYSAAGTYTVTLVVTDINGCKDSISKSYTTSVNITKSKDTSLCGSSPVQLLVGGGISYSWMPSSTLSNPNIANPVATPITSTVYHVIVTNAIGCTKTDSVKISVNNLPAISKSNDTIVCANTTVQLLAGGGTTYSWTPSSTLNNAGIPNPIATPSAATTYYVTVTNSGGCSKTDSVKIGINPPAVITKSNDTTICNQATVRIFASGGVSYLWSPASSLDNPSSANPIASPTATTLYTVTIKDSYSCLYKDSVKVSVRSTAAFTVSPDTSVCSGLSKQLQSSGGDTYIWSPTNGLDNPNISNPTVTPGASTTYTVTIHENTCNETGTLSTNVTVWPLPDVKASSSNDLTCSLGSSQLNATGATNYTWMPASGLNNSNIANPVATPSNTTVYKVIGKDNKGCINSDTVTVKAYFNMNALYLLPNSFTPNGDGLNDCFGIKYWGTVQNLDFSIYNRFGEKVFHTTDPGICWDGRYNQKLQDADIFVYIIKAKTACGFVERKGTIALLR